MEGLDGNKPALTEDILPRLGLRSTATWPGGAGPAGTCVQLSPRPPLSDGSRLEGEVVYEQRYPPPEIVPAPDHGDRRCLEITSLSRFGAAGEAQVESRRSSTPLPPPIPLHHHQRPPWQTIDLALLARVTAGNVKSAEMPPAATWPHFGRPSAKPVIVGSSSSPPALRNRETAAPPYAGSGGRGSDGGPEPANDLPRNHRKGPPSPSPWSSYSSAGPPLIGQLIASNESRTRIRGSSLGELSSAQGRGAKLKGQVGDGGAAGGRSRLPPLTDETSCHRYVAVSITTGAKRMRCSAGGAGGVAGVDEFSAPMLGHVGSGRKQPNTLHRGAPSLPSAHGGERHRGFDALQGGWHAKAMLSSPTQESAPPGVGGPLPSIFSGDFHWWSRAPAPSDAEAEAEGTVSLSRAPSWDTSSGGPSSEHARPSKEGGGRVSRGRGEGRWHGEGGLIVDTGMCAEPECDGFPPDDRLLRGSAQLRGRHQPHSSSQWQYGRPHHHNSQLGSIFTTMKPPRLGRRVSDPGLCSASERALVSGETNPVHLSRPRSEPVEATLTLEDNAPPGSRSSATALGEPHGDSAHPHGGCYGVVGAGAPTQRRPADQRRFSGLRPLKLSKSNKCMEDGCDDRPRYGYKDSKKPAYCAKHRVAGMIDTRHPLCKDEKCTRQPSFGMEGDRRAVYCARHKLAGMVNVTSRRCQRPGCLCHPNFGFPGDRRASYCRQHRWTGMVDVVSRRCRDPSCVRRPLYNMNGLRPVWCSRHKAPGMIDVVSARCEEQGCVCHPSFGYASDKKARRCARHRLKDMIGVKGRGRKLPSDGNTAATTAAAATATTTTTTASTYPPPP